MEIIVLVQSQDSFIVINVGFSEKPKVMNMIVGISRTTKQATARKQLEIFFSFISGFPSCATAFLRIPLEILNNL
jgi:hypothetical protein